MQQTTKYKFNLIDTSDTFSPDALNANAEKLETELARVETETAAQIAAGDSAVRSDLTSALNAAKSELQAGTAADKTALEQALATQRSELQASVTALTTALGSGGKTARIVWGSYYGTGAYEYTRTLTFGFRPDVVFVGSPSNSNSGHWPATLLRGVSKAHGDAGSGVSTISWSATGVSFVSGPSALNTSETYYYVAIGESS